jgi:hypothetical protein
MSQDVTRHKLLQAVEQALARLADGCETADDIAARLRARDCIGDISDCSTCPVAKWLIIQLTEAGFPGALPDVAAFSTNVNWYDGAAAVLVVTVKMPDLISEFIVEFDDGAYPHLATRPDIAQEILDEH